jgi:succinate dehydrogenase / fumarate reductase, cytochrome b subunit
VSENAATGSADTSNPAKDFFTKHHFLLRRLHSLSGIIPVGMFVIVHLFTNAQMIRWTSGHDEFQHEVDFIHSTPALLFVEIGLWLGIGFHALLGVGYMTGAVPNPTKYKFRANYFYTLQRITAWIALVFIFVHIATLRWRFNLLGMWPDTPFYWRGADVPNLDASLADVPMTTPLTAYALQVSWAVLVFYIIGVSSVIFHWCNGLWTAAITWGATISKGAQKRWGQACAGLALSLAVFSGLALVGALRFDLENDTTAQQRQVMVHLKLITAEEAAGANGDASVDTKVEAK